MTPTTVQRLARRAAAGAAVALTAAVCAFAPSREAAAQPAGGSPELALVPADAAGFVHVATDLEDAPTLLPDATTYHDYLRDVILGVHLARLPSDELRHTFVETLTRQAAAGDPPFFLDYWRLNMSAQKP